MLVVFAHHTCHPDSLKSIELKFLSLNATSLVQQIYMEIIKNAMTLYRSRLVNCVLVAIQESLLTSLQELTRFVQGLMFYNQHSLLPIFGGE